MSSLRWGDANTVKFIGLLKRSPCLWDKDHGDYRVMRRREAAYRALCAAMSLSGFTVLDVKNKIKNLRSTYSQERKKIAHHAAAGRRYEPRLSWFRTFASIMRGSVRSLGGGGGGGGGGGRGVKHESDDDDSSGSPRADPLRARPSTEPSPQPQRSADEADTTEEEEVEEEAGGDGEELASAYGVMVEENRSVVVAEAKPPPHYASPAAPAAPCAASHGAQDEFDIFGSSVAMQLRQMPLAPALRAQLRMQSLLAEERIRLQARDGGGGGGE